MILDVKNVKSYYNGSFRNILTVVLNLNTQFYKNSIKDLFISVSQR